MPERITHITQEELLSRIVTDRASLAALWQNLADERMTQRPGPQEDWSVKDLIAHILVWENTTISQIERLLDGEIIKFTGTIDELNEQAFQDNIDRQLSDILAEFDSNLSRLETAIARLSDEQINDPEVAHIEGRALRGYLIGDTFGHYNLHREALQRFVESLD